MLAKSPEPGGTVNLPAVFIIGVVASLLCAGTKESATLDACLVVVHFARARALATG